MELQKGALSKKKFRHEGPEHFVPQQAKEGENDGVIERRVLRGMLEFHESHPGLAVVTGGPEARDADHPNTKTEETRPSGPRISFIVFTEHPRAK